MGVVFCGSWMNLNNLMFLVEFGICRTILIRSFSRKYNKLAIKFLNILLYGIIKYY